MMRIDDVVVFMGVSLEKISPVRQSNSPLVPNRSFQLKKRRQLFIGAHSERLPSPRSASTIQIVRP
jgi:hypothetical protein